MYLICFLTFTKKIYFSVSALSAAAPDKSFIINELNQTANLSNSVPDVGGVISGKHKEPMVLMVEPYFQSSEDEKLTSKKKEQR